MNDKEKLRGYRGLIRRDIDELEVRLNTIEAKIDRLSEKLDKHINFIDDTYEGLKNPIKMATRFFKR
jgi:archaellum component FlaC|tara:strand:+ start:496 stop:696 length:201 start_codon:yes stop_codon:yes gene_type:complete